ncbi:MAG: D-alanyl-D-alanine carboxypeptidase [Alphaproteobacteria bacterium]|nr:D-alanyl-D-alanine carboxypeptidase [Alphaproteobacteria bacterium]
MALVVAAALGSVPSAAEAKAKKRVKLSVKRHRTLPVDRNALYADIVIEARTGRILHAANAGQQRHPASLTKMMTLYLTFQALESGKLSLEQRISVSSHAAAQSPSKLGLRPGQSLRVQDAVLGVVTESANDAAVVLAEALGGSESRFAQMMTRQAQALGMKQTRFENASGLPDPDQVTTARDMAVLGHALIYHYPRYYAFFSHESFTYAGRTHRNHNHLMERYDGMDGIKTGYIRASGFNLVASAVRGDTRLIGVVFGGRSTLGRDNQMAQLLDRSFAAGESGSTAAREEMLEETVAQGDSSDVADSHYIALPAKTAAVFQLPGARAANGETASAAESDRAWLSAPTNWGIQIGAYNDAAGGQEILSTMRRNMPALLERADPILQKVRMEDGAVFYRARFMGMESATARSICSYLVKRGQGCQVVAPEQANG